MIKEIVTRAKQVKHSIRLNGKHVIIYDINDSSRSYTGIYQTIDSMHFTLRTQNPYPFDQIPRHKKNWTVEELIETDR